MVLYLMLLSKPNICLQRQLLSDTDEIDNIRFLKKKVNISLSYSNIVCTAGRTEHIGATLVKNPTLGRPMFVTFLIRRKNL